MPQSAFPIDNTLTAIAIAYRNRAHIADEVLPRTDALSKAEFKYMKYALEQGFTVPDTKVGRRSAVNEVNFKGAEVTDSTDDHALEHPLPKYDIENAPEGVDIRARTTEWLMQLVDTGREVRAANLVFSSGNYAGGNTEALAGADKFSDPTSKALTTMLDALDVPVMRPNVVVFGQAEWRAFRTNEQINKAVHGNSGDAGAATREQIASLLEVEKVLVGRSLVNDAKPGQTPNMTPAWAGNIAMIYQDSVTARAGGTVFGFTAQHGGRISGSEFDSKIGMRGGERVRTGESVKEVISAPDLGYLITAVL